MLLLDPFYGVFETSTKIAHLLNRLTLIAEFGGLGYFIYVIANGGGLPVLGWIGLCVGAVIAFHLVNIVLRFIWSVILTFVFGTTDADDIAEGYERRVEVKRLLNEERTRLLVEAKEKKNRAEIEKEWAECGEPSFED